jgi:hypothetical protein
VALLAKLPAAVALAALVLSIGVDAHTTPGVDAHTTRHAAAAKRLPEASLVAAAPRAADLYVAPSGSDGGRCTRRAPCASFDRAYQVAKPGDVIEVAAGRYPAQTIEADPDKRSPKDVILRPARGARVEIEGTLVVEASHVEIRRMAASVWKSRLGDDQTFRNLNVNIFIIHGSSNVSVIGGDVGPSTDVDSQVTSLEGQVPRKVLIDRVAFHDARKRDPAAHVECLQFGSGIDVVVRRSSFERCSDHDIFVRSWGSVNASPHPLSSFTIENNFFGRPLRGFYSLRLAFQDGRPCEDFLVRNNSALTNMYSDCEARGVRFLGNIQPSKTGHSCSQGHGAVWDWNVYAEGEPCGENDIVAPARFRKPVALDLHLMRGSAAVGRAAPASYPDVDIDGDPRPRGGKADAGADER